MNFKELKNKSELELKKIFHENVEKLRGLRFKIALKQVKNMREMRVIKKTNARILTILNELASKVSSNKNVKK